YLTYPTSDISSSFLRTLQQPPRSTLFPTRRSSDLANQGSRQPVNFFDRESALPHQLNGLQRSKQADPIRDEIGGVFHRESDRLRSEEHTSELQSRFDLVCRLLLEKKKQINIPSTIS